MSGTNMIEIRNLCKTYGDLVIFDHLDLTLAPDTVYCLTGASGIGKTTLLHMLLGLEAWDSGEILGLDGLRTAAGFQEDRLRLSFSPLENIRMALGKGGRRGQTGRLWSGDGPRSPRLAVQPVPIPQVQPPEG